MTLRQDMIQVLARAPSLLDNAAGPARNFILSQQAGDGGFKGRDKISDLYYTVFGTEILIAMGSPLPAERLEAFLRSFDCGKDLDLVHLSSLARCWADLAEVTGRPIESPLREGLAQRLRDLQCRYGGFSTSASKDHGNAYGCFLALVMCQDLDIDMPEQLSILQCIEALATNDKGFANEPTALIATTPSTAAALCVYHMLGRTLPEAPVVWLLDRIHSQGGFCAMAGKGPLCLPDLLSTATAFHALSYSNMSMPQPREHHLDFLDSLWNPRGGFSGSWLDPTVDCEYTYYGLLTLGHLEGMA